MLSSKLNRGWALFIGFFGLYYYLYVHPFFAGQFLPGGDTLLGHTLFYAVLHSLKTHATFPWWDASITNGYPLYFNFLAGEINLLAVHNVLFLALFKALAFLPVDLSHWIFFYTFVYVPLLNAALIFLTVRLFTKHPASALFAVVLYLFGSYTLLNFHDAPAVAALPLPLLVLYATLRYYLTPTPRHLTLVLLSLAFLLGGFCANVLFSPVFWLATFGLMLLLFGRHLGRSLHADFAALRKSQGLVFLGLLLALGLGASATIVTVHSNRNILRNRGGIVSYETSVSLSTRAEPVESSPGWGMALTWLAQPLENISWHGHDNRYLGIASLLLLLVAALGCHRQRLFWVFVLTYLTCNWFLVVTTKNLLYARAMETLPFLKHVLNMATIFPRGGPSLFLIFAACLGLDALLVRTRREPGFQTVQRWPFVPLGLLGAAACFALPFVLPATYRMKMDNAFQMGLCFALFSFLVAALLKWGQRPYLVRALFLLTLLDLVLSQSAHLDRGTARFAALGPADRLEWLRVPYDEALLPDENGERPLFSLKAPSHYHNRRTLYGGFREWLVLQTNEAAAPLLTNWNFKRQRALGPPPVRFCSGAYRIPLAQLGDLASLSRTIQEKTPRVYVHEDFPEVPLPTTDCVALKASYGSDASLEVDIPSESGGVLFVESNWDSYWKASTAAETLTPFRANFAFMALPVKAGSRVRFAFDPYPVKLVFLLFYLVALPLLLSLFEPKKWAAQGFTQTALSS